MSKLREATVDYAREKQRVLRVLPFAVFVFGFAASALDDGGAVALVAIVVAVLAPLILAVKWCRLDAAERGFQLWRRFTLLTVVFPGPLITVPCYLLASRGRRGFAAVGVFFLISTILILLDLVAMWTVDQLRH